MLGRTLRNCLFLAIAISVCIGLLQAFVFSKLMGRAH